MDTTTMKAYIKEKLDVLNDFYIKPKANEIKHLKSLTSEIQVDNYVRDLFNKYL